VGHAKYELSLRANYAKQSHDRRRLLPFTPLRAGYQRTVRSDIHQKTDDGKVMKLGINTYTYMWSIGFQGANPAYPDRSARPSKPLTLVGLLEKAQSLGVKLVQTGPNLPLDQLPELDLDRFIHIAKDWGIQLELGTRGLENEHLARQAVLARRAGATLIRTLPEIHTEYITDVRILLPAVRELLPMLVGEGMQLAIENGRIPAEDLRWLLDEVNSPYVGVVLDMVNSLAVPEGWKEVTCQLARHTMCVHYKDFTMRRAWHMMGFLCEGTPAGKGALEPEWLFEALKASPYDYNVIIELWPPELDTLEATIALEQQWAAESVQALRRFIQD
jgi:3-oxoisoapionate decarboxylase